MANITDLATGEVLLTQNRTSRKRHLAHVPGQGRPIRDWVKLAVTRARNSGMPAVFWLDPYRPHENRADQKVNLPAGSRHQGLLTSRSCGCAPMRIHTSSAW